MLEMRRGSWPITFVIFNLLVAAIMAENMKSIKWTIYEGI